MSLLPQLQGEGSKSAKGATFMSRLFGRTPSTTDRLDDTDSPRNYGTAAVRAYGELTAPLGSAADHTAAKHNWNPSPRQPGAVATTGLVAPTGKMGPPTPLSMTTRVGEQAAASLVSSPRSRKVLFAGPSAKNLDVAAEGASSFNNSRVAGMLDHNHVFKRSHTTDLAAAMADRSSSNPLGASTSLHKPLGTLSPAANAQGATAGRGADDQATSSIPPEPVKHAATGRVSGASGGGSRSRTPSLVVEFTDAKRLQQTSLASPAGPGGAKTKLPGPADDREGFAKTPEPAAPQPAQKPAAATDSKPASQAPAHPSAPLPASSASAAPSATPPARKYKLLSVYPLLAPNMRRDDWSTSQFAIDKKLHSGYASEVYRAKDIQSDELLAVKVYNLNQLGSLNKVQLIREIRLHGSFAHRNIIELFVAFQEDHRVVLAQRYAEGGDLLKALHKAGGRLTEKSAVQMVIQPLLNCLVYLHSKGITHRDIKPENILFDGDGVLKLADFGLAINMNEEHAVTRAGTLHYMAPEVVKNPLKDHPDDFKNEVRFHYNAVVDSWAVGCLAFELLVGFPPFMAQTQQEVVKNINTMEVRYPKKLSEECVEFISAALERNPQDRATTQELSKHAWINIHQRRNSVRSLQFEAQGAAGGARPVAADFAAGTAVAAKGGSARRPADHGPGRSGDGSKMAPF